MSDRQKVQYGNVRYEWMTPEEVVRAREAAPVAFVPIGPLEWHGPHLPMGTDALHAHHVALGVASMVGGVVLPPYFIGSETVRKTGNGVQTIGSLGFTGNERIVGMDFPGNPVKSTYFEDGTFAVAIREIIQGLKKNGFRLIVLLNGHGAHCHKQTLARLAAEQSEPPAVRVEFVPAWVPPEPPFEDPGHADKWETAIMMAIRPDCVRVDKLPSRDVPMRYRDFGIVDGRAFDGAPAEGFCVPEWADPRYATPEEGEQIVAREIDHVARLVRSFLEDPGNPDR